MPNPTDAATILLIEDDSDLANVMKALLEHVPGPERYRVLLAGDLAQGLDLLAQEEVACVVLDLDLASSESTEPLRRLRAEDRTTPVIVLSGRSDYEEQARLMLGQGADQYLVKGYIDRGTLTVAIQGAQRAGLKRHRLLLVASEPATDVLGGEELLQVASETILALVQRFGIPLTALTAKHPEEKLEDEGMEALGRLLASAVRRSDLVARTARSEFLVLLAGTSEASAPLDRIRTALEADATLRDDAARIVFGRASLDLQRPQSIDALVRAARDHPDQ